MLGLLTNISLNPNRILTIKTYNIYIRRTKNEKSNCMWTNNAGTGFSG